MELTVDFVPDRNMVKHTIVNFHYLHRWPNVQYAIGLYRDWVLEGVVTFGQPASPHVKVSACRANPEKVVELNRLWVSDDLPRNTESWFLSRALKLLPPLVIVSYADTGVGHQGYVYRASNFYFGGESAERYDYEIPGKHSRGYIRSGIPSSQLNKVPRSRKMRYWTVTGNRRERKELEKIVGWSKLDWKQVTSKGASTP